jgi:sec-independent protein translocase protein TatA
MGLSGISPVSLIIILLIVLVLFGGKRLRNLGTDLGGAIKGFRSSVREEPEEPAESEKPLQDQTGEGSDTSRS